MPEFDAFGRKIEEGTDASNPVPASESGLPDVDSPATAVPESPSAPPPEATPAASTEGLKLSGRPSRGVHVTSWWVTVLVLVVVIGSGALIAWDAIDTTKDAIRAVVPRLPSITVDTDGPGIAIPETPDPPQEQKPPPTGLAPRSMIRRAQFASAMDEIRKSGFGTPTYVRVAPDRVDAQMRKGDRLRNVQVGYDGELRQIGSAVQTSALPPTIAYSNIDTRAPERLVRGGVRKGGVKTDQIDYLVVSQFTDDVIWNAYFKNNVRYQGDAAGRVERKF